MMLFLGPIRGCYRGGGGGGETYSNGGGWEKNHRDSCNRFHGLAVSLHHIAISLSDDVEGLTGDEHQGLILRSVC